MPTGAAHPSSSAKTGTAGQGAKALGIVLYLDWKTEGGKRQVLQLKRQSLPVVPPASRTVANNETVNCVYARLPYGQLS